ncbi:hypothetical protein P9112_004075 [Eukaryota sp. TZLM1-RC]
MSLVASGTPNSVQIQLYYYLVFGARRFGATTIGLPVCELLSSLFTEHFAAEAKKNKKVVHPDTTLEVAYKLTGNFGSRTVACLQNWLSSNSGGNAPAFSVQVRPQQEINVKFYDAWLKDKEKKEIETITIEQLKSHPANSKVVLADHLWNTWLEIINEGKGSITRIPESIIPFLGDAKNNLFSVELAEQVAQYSAAQLFKIREQVLELLDVLESTFLKKLNCFVISLGKRTSSEAALSSDVNEAFKRVAAAEDTQHTD